MFYNDNSGYVRVEDKLKQKISFNKAIELYEKGNIKKGN